MLRSEEKEVLVDDMIPTFSVEQENSPVGGGTADVRQVVVGGNPWFVKRWTNNTGTFAGEAMGHLLAAQVGVRTPVFGVVDAEPTAWLSKEVTVGWDPKVASPEHVRLLGGIIMLDAVLANSDRHPGNIGFDDGEIVAFDFDKSPLGIPFFAPGYDQRSKVQKVIPPQILSGLSMEEVIAGAGEVAGRLAKLTPTQVAAVVDHAVRGSSDPDR